jgi:hypothetical protein
MSLAVVFKGPEGLVLAADSRVTMTMVEEQQSPEVIQRAVSHRHFDNATKLLGLGGHPNVGIVTFGQGSIGEEQPRMAHGFIPEFEAHINANGRGDVGEESNLVPVEEMARQLGEFFLEQWKKAEMPESEDTDPMVFLVAGFDESDAYGRLFRVSVPNRIDPEELIQDNFGIEWGGQSFLAERLMVGMAPRAMEILHAELKLTDDQLEVLGQKLSSMLQLPIPVQFLPLQDAVDLSTFLVDMTATVMTWTAGPVQGVGGDVDVATITRTDGFQSVKQKRIRPWGE